MLKLKALGRDVTGLLEDVVVIGGMPGVQVAELDGM